MIREMIRDRAEEEDQDWDQKGVMVRPRIGI